MQEFEEGRWGRSTDPDVFERPDGTGTYLYSDVDVMASLVEETGNAYFRILVHLYGLWKQSPDEWVEGKPQAGVELQGRRFPLYAAQSGTRKTEYYLDRITAKRNL